MAPDSNIEIILIAGPTASGKSDLGQRLAQKLNGEIVNMDSQQCYRHLVIGTGKPKMEERKKPHWLYEEVDPGNWMSAGEFARRAQVVVQDIHQRGHFPVLVGGTGLYLRAFLEGLDPLPPRDPQVRKRLEGELVQEGAETMYQRLMQIDPESAPRVKPQDRLRLIRALEIWELTGKAPSTLLKRGRCQELRYRTETYWLTPGREELRQRIAKRVEQMFSEGWPQEVRGFIQQGQDPRDWPNKPIGYSEIAEAWQGLRTWEGLQENIILRTQRYAKRQETFFRGLFANPAYGLRGSKLICCPQFGTKVTVGA